MNHNLSPGLMPPAPPFTEKQGQYLAFIYAYTRASCKNRNLKLCAPQHPLQVSDFQGNR